MATLKVPFWGDLELCVRLKRQSSVEDSAYARDYVRNVYEKVGVTPELKRVYATYVANEQQRERSRANGG